MVPGDCIARPLVVLIREKVQRLCEPRVYDHDDATRDFGYNPRMFRIGIVDEVKEYLQNK